MNPTLIDRVITLERELQRLKRDLTRGSVVAEPAPQMEKASLFGSVRGGDITDEMVEEAKHSTFRDLGGVPRRYGAALYVMDTHVLVWYFTGNRRLGLRFREEIDATRRTGGRLLVPTVVLSEALYIAEKGRVYLDFATMYRLVQQEPEFEVVGYGQEIFEETVRVTAVPEMHDRIIVATARYYGAGVLSNDRIILDSGEVEVL